MDRRPASVPCKDDHYTQRGQIIGCSQGKVLSTYTHTTEDGTLDGASVTLATYKQTERHIYGSSRLGMETGTVELIATSALSPYWADAQPHTTNADDRVYEMSNHLGNVLATFTARKLPLTEAGVVVGFAPHVTSLSDYYPFGSGMEGRVVDAQSVADANSVDTPAPSTYRYGFNTQEKDDEIYGKGNSYSAEFWQYDARLGRRWNLDPKPNTMFSGYATFQCNPLRYLDVRGDTVTFGEGAEDLVMEYVNPSSKKYNEDFASKYHELDADQAIFHVLLTDTKGGKLDFDGHAILIEIGIRQSAPNISIGATLFEEFEHAIQCLYGELGFIKDDNGNTQALGLDQIDEANGFSFAMEAEGNYSSGRVKKMHRAIAARDLAAIRVVSTSRSRHYSFLPSESVSAEADLYDFTGQTLQTYSGNNPSFVRPLRRRKTPLQLIYERND